MVRIAIQARMNSSRLPGKILAELAGRPLLEYVVRRLQAVRLADGSSCEVLVATTMAAADDATEAACQRLDVRCFRGSETDVLARYVAATADLTEDDVVVRATADNPLYCLQRTARIIQQHLQQRNDYTCIAKLSYVVPEAIRAGALRRMAGLATSAYCREHVTPYFRQQDGTFRVMQLPDNWQGLQPGIRLTVDTPAELARMRAICEAMASDDPLVALDDVYQWCRHERAEQTAR